MSLSVLLKMFPKLFTGFLYTDGIRTPPKEKQCLSDTLSFLRTKVLDLAVLKVILALEMSHRHLGTGVVVTVSLSMKALIGGWRVLDLDRGLLHSTSADLTSMIMAKANRVTDMVQPVIMPFSR